MTFEQQNVIAQLREVYDRVSYLLGSSGRLYVACYWSEVRGHGWNDTVRMCYRFIVWPYGGYQIPSDVPALLAL